MLSTPISHMTGICRALFFFIFGFLEHNQQDDWDEDSDDDDACLILFFGGVFRYRRYRYNGCETKPNHFIIKFFPNSVWCKHDILFLLLRNLFEKKSSFIIHNCKFIWKFSLSNDFEFINNFQIKGKVKVSLLKFTIQDQFQCIDIIWNPTKFIPLHVFLTVCVLNSG